MNSDERLLDIKFDIANKGQATVDAVCAEWQRLQQAVARGEGQAINFKDPARRLAR